MKNLLALLAAALVTFAVVGWYLDWYRINARPSDQGRTQVTIDLNNQKIKEDLKKGKEKVRDMLDKDKTSSGPQPHEVFTSTGEQLLPPPASVRVTPPAPAAPKGEDFIFVLPGYEAPTPPPNYQPAAPPKQR